MTRRCFFVQEIDSDSGTVCLPPDASHHLEKVLRLRTGDTIEIRDGNGEAWEGEVAEIGKSRVSVRLTGRCDRSALESPLRITLALALARSDIMDLAVRQATELGAAGLLIFRAARSQYGLSKDHAGRKKDRWIKIAREAICQCGRTRMPGIEVMPDLDALIAACSPGGDGSGFDLRIFAQERGGAAGLAEIGEMSRPCCNGVLAAIGPEGGWESDEIFRLIRAGFDPVHLGPRILRYETAVIALISSIQLLWGDMGGTRRKGGD
ncbi:MAG: 16S rRNA (uracil(1498)-N(3))-methyltransferase [Desulfobacteraceae bacterium]|nr:16S rRNA (uracil(1498)-N(3))-methyltransferase [Desulfobacteraceae bacterium]